MYDIYINNQYISTVSGYDNAVAEATLYANKHMGYEIEIRLSQESLNEFYYNV
jgi:hypothetical protein